MESSDGKIYSKCFNPKYEGVEEFLERFRLQNKSALSAAGDDLSAAAELLANSLPTNIITDLQRRLKPTSLTNATYAQLETHLKAAYGTSKTNIGAAVAFINRKQRQNESIESYAKAVNDLASQCNYKDCCRNKMLRDIFVSGLRCSKLLTTYLLSSLIETLKKNLSKTAFLPPNFMNKPYVMLKILTPMKSLIVPATWRL